jgi:hypothetical protein
VSALLFFAGFRSAVASLQSWLSIPEMMKHCVARCREAAIVDLLRSPGKLIKLLRVGRRLNHAPVHAERNRQVNRRVIATPL